MSDNLNIDYEQLLKDLYAPDILVEVTNSKHHIRIEMSCPAKHNIPTRIYTETVDCCTQNEIQDLCRQVLQLHLKASFMTMETILPIHDLTIKEYNG